MIKVLHVSANDLIGNRFNGYDLAFSGASEVSHEMVVWNKQSINSKSGSFIAEGPIKNFYGLIQRGLNLFGLDGLFAFASLFILFKKSFFRADIIHLHIIHTDSFFSLLLLPIIARFKTLVWTLHDPWALTGGCIHSFDCNSWETGCKIICKYPRRRAYINKLTAFINWRIKFFVHKYSNIHYVTASKWMYGRCIRSPMINANHIHLIPFGLSDSFFSQLKIKNFELRKKFVILFRDAFVESDLYKGSSHVVEFINNLPASVEVRFLIIGEGDIRKHINPRFEVSTNGWVNERKLQDLLDMTDLLLMPSIQETFGMLAIESMARGVPVLSYDQTSLEKVTNAPLCSISVENGNVIKLVDAFLELYYNREKLGLLSKNAHDYSKDNYRFFNYVKGHDLLYKSLINKRLK